MWPIDTKRQAVRVARVLAGEMATLRPVHAAVYRLGGQAARVYGCRWSATQGRVVEVR